MTILSSAVGRNSAHLNDSDYSRIDGLVLSMARRFRAIPDGPDRAIRRARMDGETIRFINASCPSSQDKADYYAWYRAVCFHGEQF